FKTPSSKHAINDISRGIKAQKELQKLTLILEECTLSDLEISGIADGISHQHKLSHIHICLKDNKGIISPGLIELFRSLRDLPLIRTLYLDLSGIPHLNDQSLRGLLDVLSKNIALENLGFLISECKNLTD